MGHFYNFMQTGSVSYRLYTSVNIYVSREIEMKKVIGLTLIILTARLYPSTDSS